jgi:hypothetical protein
MFFSTHLSTLFLYSTPEVISFTGFLYLVPGRQYTFFRGQLNVSDSLPLPTALPYMIHFGKFPHVMRRTFG